MDLLKFVSFCLCRFNPIPTSLIKACTRTSWSRSSKILHPPWCVNRTGGDRPADGVHGGGLPPGPQALAPREDTAGEAHLEVCRQGAA